MGGMSRVTSGLPMAGGLRGLDMSVLSSILPPDPEEKRKYEAMGLPDPVAFAALTALGAIPNPMDLLNSMMLAAQDRIESDAAPTSRGPQEPVPGGMGLGPELSTPPPASATGLAVPPGKSFVEAFNELQRQQEEPRPASAGPVGGYAAAAQRARGQQPSGADADVAEGERLEERLAKSAKELAEQARIAADRAKEVAQTAAQMATANRDASSAVDPEVVRPPAAPSRGVAQVFSAAADDDQPEEPPRAGGPSLQTLSSLLTGKQAADGLGGTAPGAAGQAGHEKISISRLPPGVTESAVRLECARHGAVTSVILEADGSAAYATFAAPDMAANAVRRMNGRQGLLGSTGDPPQVRLIAEIPDSMRLAAVPLRPTTEPRDVGSLPEYLRPREEKKRKASRTRKKSHSRSQRRRRSERKRQRKDRSMVRWLDRSRSNSHTATGQYIRATGCSSTVRWWEKKESSSSRSSGRSGSRRKASKQEEDENSRRPRQVAVRGNWAQFVHGSASYYYNVLTGQTTWDQPSDFDAQPSRRPWESAAHTGSAAGVAAAAVAGVAAPRATGMLI